MSFSSIYSGDAPVFSFEFFPPKKSQDLPAALDLVERLSALGPDFMTVTYRSNGETGRRTREMTSFIANELKIPAVAHLTCAGHTAAEIDSVLDQLGGKGIKHILALRGDVEGGGKFIKPTGSFSCARDLVRHIKSRGDFSIAVAGYPETHPDAKSPEADILYLKEKVDAGAEVILTQLFFDSQVYFSFCDRVQSSGIKVPVVPGIMPIRNVLQLRRFTSMCGASIPQSILADLNKISGDPKAVLEYGTVQCSVLCRRLLEGGAPGIHFFTLNKSHQVERVVRGLKEGGHAVTT